MISFLLCLPDCFATEEHRGKNQWTPDKQFTLNLGNPSIVVLRGFGPFDSLASMQDTKYFPTVSGESPVKEESDF